MLCSGRTIPAEPLMSLSVDLFFSFRSPYSYLALPKTLKLVADYDATVNLRPVYPLAVRVPGFFKKTNPQFLPYVALDSSRVAQRENIPYRFPRPDPIVQDLATLEVAEHQPYIHRLTRLGALAQTRRARLRQRHRPRAVGRHGERLERRRSSRTRSRRGRLRSVRDGRCDLRRPRSLPAGDRVQRVLCRYRHK